MGSGSGSDIPKWALYLILGAGHKARSNSKQLMAVLDGINHNGKGCAGLDIQKSWEMKRQLLSPAYTTRFSDLMRVKL